MVQYRELKNPDDARDAYRRQQAQDAELSAQIAEANADAIRRLRQMNPGRPFEIGTEAQGAEQQAADGRKRADGLRALAGVKDDDLPWDRIAATIRNQLGQEEEMLIRATDEAENHEAYNVSEGDANFRMMRQEARVEAYQAALDAAETNVVKPQASRRSQPTPTPPAPDTA